MINENPVFDTKKKSLKPKELKQKRDKSGKLRPSKKDRPEYRLTPVKSFRLKIAD